MEEIRYGWEVEGETYKANQHQVPTIAHLYILVYSNW